MSDQVERVISPVVIHSARTAVAAVVSLIVAGLFQLPEAYWAPITTLVITQSSLGVALTVSWQRFIGTIFGTVVGAIVASQFGPYGLVFGTSIFVLGLFRVVAPWILTHIGSRELRCRLCCWCRGRVRHGKSRFIGSPKCPLVLG